MRVRTHLVWIPVPNLKLPLGVAQPSAVDMYITGVLIAANRIGMVPFQGEGELYVKSVFRTAPAVTHVAVRERDPRQ